MTIEQFEKIIDYLLEVMLPPNVSDDDPVTEAQLLDALEQRCDYLKGEVLRKTHARAGEPLPTYQEMRGILKGDD